MSDGQSLFERVRERQNPKSRKSPPEPLPPIESLPIVPFYRWKLRLMPGRPPLPVWLLRMERWPTRYQLPLALLICLVANLELLALGVGIYVAVPLALFSRRLDRAIEAIQPATPWAGVISFIEFSIVGVFGVLAILWLFGTLPPKRPRLRYGPLIFPAIFALGISIYMGWPFKARSGSFILSYGLSFDEGQFEKFVVIDSFTRDRYIGCTGDQWRCLRDKVVVARPDSPGETWEIDAHQIPKEEEFLAFAPAQFTARTKGFLPGLTTMDTHSIRFDDSLFALTATSRDHDGRESEISLSSFTGNFALVVAIPISVPRDADTVYLSEQGFYGDIMHWLDALGSRPGVKILVYEMGWPGDGISILEGQHVQYMNFSFEAYLRSRCGFRVRPFFFCLFDRTGFPLLNGTIETKDDQRELIETMATSSRNTIQRRPL